MGEGEEDTQINECRIWTDPANDEAQMCKEKSLSELSVVV
jgi:hypothetical protein